MVIDPKCPYEFKDTNCSCKDLKFSGFYNKETFKREYDVKCTQRETCSMWIKDYRLLLDAMCSNIDTETLNKILVDASPECYTMMVREISQKKHSV